MGCRSTYSVSSDMFLQPSKHSNNTSKVSAQSQFSRLAPTKGAGPRAKGSSLTLRAKCDRCHTGPAVHKPK